ncbi:MAG: hypothetical protein JWO02_3072 [Solirubrobacterales bacterium]|nr:hypothetical protein [Solirubrobacterales bacterium]
MYARVSRWDDGEAAAIRSNAEGISARAAGGPPEGVPSTGVMMLTDPDNGKAMVIGFFETLDDLRQGDAVLNTMSPPTDGMGTRAPVEVYEVAVDLKA